MAGKARGVLSDLNLEPCTEDQFVRSHDVDRQKSLRCCSRKPTYLGLLRCGPNPDELYEICSTHILDSDYYPYIRTACVASA